MPDDISDEQVSAAIASQQGQPTASPPASVSTPDPEPVAVLAATGSGAADEPPAAVEEPTPAETDETPAFELDDGTVDALVTLRGDRILQNETVQAEINRRAQSIADKQMAQQRADPEYDQEYQQATRGYQNARQQASQAVSKLTPLLQALQNGEYVNPADVARETHTALEAAQAAENFGIQGASQAGFVQMDATADEMLSPHRATVIAPAADGRPEITVESAYANALETYNRLARSGTPENRQKALPDFTRRTIAIARAAGIAEGVRMQGEKSERETKAKVELAKANIDREALAKAGARTAPAAGAGAAKNTPVLSRENLMKGSNEDFTKLLADAGYRV